MQEPCGIARARGMLRDTLRRQVKIEIRGLHALRPGWVPRDAAGG
jgi:hypothetical protein